MNLKNFHGLRLNELILVLKELSQTMQAVKTDLEVRDTLSYSKPPEWKKNVLSLLEPRLTFNGIISWLNGASVVCNVWHILGDVVGTVICVVFGTVICVVFGTEVGVVVGTAVVVCCTNFAGHLVNLGGWYGHSGPSTVAMGRKTLFLKYPT